jgi:magnesium-transporting ATPase (P-type)
VLFQISVFQYVMTAIAFSIAKPFRKPIYSNLPYLLSLIFIFGVNLAFVFVPNHDTDSQNTEGSSWLNNYFLMEPYTKDGVSYYGYRFWILAGVVINSVMTIVFEKLFVTRVTKHYDDKA